MAAPPSGETQATTKIMNHAFFRLVHSSERGMSCYMLVSCDSCVLCGWGRLMSILTAQVVVLCFVSCALRLVRQPPLLVV
jgi:hypothetical protein